MIGIIYKTTCLINGKIYVGQTIQLKKKSYLGSGQYFKKAFKKYGRKNFIRETLCECNTLEELNKLEDYWIEELKSYLPEIGYNIKKNSDLHYITYYKLYNSEKYNEIMKNFSNCKLGNKYSLGIIQSEETRKKKSESMKGKNKNKKRTIESKLKSSESHKGQKAWNKGVPMSEKAKEKRRQTILGKKRGPYKKRFKYA